MKSKISKIMGVGLALVLVASMMAFALPASASPGENEWSEFALPKVGADGDWFYDPDIANVGPMAQAINGDLYAYVAGVWPPDIDGEPVAADRLFKSEDDGRSWLVTGYEKVEIVDPATLAISPPEPIVDMVCSSMSEDVIYLTDGNYVYKSINGGTSFNFVAKGSLEAALENLPNSLITCLDVAYDGSGQPMVFIGTKDVEGLAGGSVYWIADGQFGASWLDLGLSSYDVYAVGCAPDFATSYKIFAVATGIPAPDLALNIDGAAITLAVGDDAAAIAAKIATAVNVGGATTAEADAAAVVTFTYRVAGLVGNDFEVPVADPNYSGGTVTTPIILKNGAEAVAQVDTVTFVVTPDQVYDLMIAVGETEHLFIHTAGSSTSAVQIVAAFVALINADPTLPVAASGTTTLILTADVPGTDGSFTTTSSLEIDPDWLITIVPDPAANAEPATATITIEAPVILPTVSVTQIVTNTGTSMAWSQFGANLKADGIDDFVAEGSSDICFPDDYADTNTLFVGVVGTYDEAEKTYGPGGDVYSVTASSALDLNVAGSGKNTNICSLDILNDALIAGVYDAGVCDPTTELPLPYLYYSTDGGWTWAASAKNPTGEGPTSVLWYGDSALAATSGAECAVSMSCGEEVGEFWNQISLIATDIEFVFYLDHSPGYKTKSETMFMLTGYEHPLLDDNSYSLFRHDGIYWERVFWNENKPLTLGWMVLVSPDFNDTNAVYVANSHSEIWRTPDAGCSWTKLRYLPTAKISSGVVIDEDTGIAGGGFGSGGVVYKTTRHGARPWDEYKVTGAGNILSFDLEPGYEDPGTILLGDTRAQVFISEDGGATWDLVGDCATVLGTGRTSVVFDPDYATNHTIYAAAGNVIARCVIDPALAWSKQEWDDIYTDDNTGADFWGIAVAGDTALYVGDFAAVAGDNGGVLRSLNPMAPAVPINLVEFERVTTGLDSEVLSGLLLTTGSNVLWAIDWGTADVWVYEDLLATPVIQTQPADGTLLATTATATIEWEPLDGATEYEAFIYSYCPTCPDNMVTFDTIETALTCNVVTGLTPGTTYFWKVRVAEGSPFLSKWSELRTFDTALGAVPYLRSPDCGQQDVILTPNFSWDPVLGAASYEIEVATNEDFSPVIASGTATVNAWVTDITLDYSTTYYWQVRAVKDGAVYSAWSVCLFTTMDEPAEPIAPITPVDVITEEITPTWIWVIIGIGAALTIAVIVLIVNTRRVP